MKENQEAEFEKLFQQAHEAGMKAGSEIAPTPMTLIETDLRDRPLPNAKTYYVSEGLCGFAWVDVRPRNSAFAKFLMKKEYASTSDYDRSAKVWVRYFNQSVERKEKYAYAFAAVLREAGINASAASRLD